MPTVKKIKTTPIKNIDIETEHNIDNSDYNYFISNNGIETIDEIDIETTNQELLTNVKNKTLDDLKSFKNETFDDLETFGATGAVVTTKAISGVGKVVESVHDGIKWTECQVYSGTCYGTAQLIGTFSKSEKENLLEYRDKVTKAAKKDISRDKVGEIQTNFFEKTNIGKNLNKNSILKYDSKTANQIQGTSENIALFLAETGATIVTGGVGGAVIGGFHQTGKSAERTYQNGTNTTALQEGAILLQGGFGALSGYASGKLGASFATESFKSITANGWADTGTYLVKGVCNKEFVKKWLTTAVKDPGNYISTILMSANDIGEFITGKKELNVNNLKDLGIKLAANFGLNVLEDGFRSILGNRIILGQKAEELNQRLKDIDKIDITNLIEEEIEKTSKEKYSISKEIFDMFDELSKKKKLKLIEDNQQLIKDFVYYDFDNKKILQLIYDNCIQILSEDDLNILFFKYFKDVNDIDGEMNEYLLKIINSCASDHTINVKKINNIAEYINTNLATSDYKSLENVNCIMRAYNWTEEMKNRLTLFLGDIETKNTVDSVDGIIEIGIDDYLKENPRTLGYNNGIRSVIRTTLEENLEQTITHESIHQLSTNGVKSGIKDILTDGTELTGINEAITEYFTQLIHGNEYKAGYCGYEYAVKSLKSFVDNGIFTVDELKNAYFKNEGSILFQKIYDISNGEIKTVDFVEAFNKAIANDITTIEEGTKELKRILNELILKK